MPNAAGQPERVPSPQPLPARRGDGDDNLVAEPLTATDMRPNCKIWLSGAPEKGLALEISGPVSVVSGEHLILFWRNFGNELRAPFVRWIIEAGAEIEIAPKAKQLLVITDGASGTALVAPFHGEQGGVSIMGRGMTPDLERSILDRVPNWRRRAQGGATSE